MNNWTRLLQALDSVFGFPNKASSRIARHRQGFDEQKNEHVFLIEYRIRVKPQAGAAKPGNHPVQPQQPKQPKKPSMLHQILGYMIDQQNPEKQTSA